MSSTRSTLPIHGNYIGYYTKRPSVQGDPRLALLPADTFTDKRVLDVGCNEGLITCEIAQTWNAKSVIGIDIDESLIRSAWRRRNQAWSTQEPPQNSSSSTEKDSERPTKRSKRELDLPAQLDLSYFPASCSHMYGPLKIPPPTPEVDSFPNNLTFHVEDFAAAMEVPAKAKGSYDVVLALSITKWVHVNAGDEGLRRFFRRIHTVLSPGGKLILEPQGWEGYAKARRINKNANVSETTMDLSLRPADFESVLSDIGFGPKQHVGFTGEGGFLRPVDLYFKL